MKRSELKLKIEEIITELLDEGVDLKPYGSDSASKTAAIRDLEKDQDFKKLPSNVQTDTKNAIKADQDGGIIKI
jgi:hypothetical protein